ncbi:cold-shock protein [Pararhodonellum marinum]|uniref:cold-shock protein n=1 Tax=Pararhodonellum marinum TaxID=2755358 RepID=UPI00188FDC9E|nr:cold shock domain-containing protein [Pararhodonellum marinum]
MAKSRETFNKKEKEKLRLKKKQEKEEKKEARRANSDKGGSLDDMIAYVDADGNITDTPPDPTKKRVIEAESIQVSTSKQADIEPEDLIRKGTVTFFNDSKGYGFIKDQENQESIFVHLNGCIDAIQENDKVTFETERTPKGLSAIEVKLIPKT